MGLGQLEMNERIKGWGEEEEETWDFPKPGGTL